MARTRTRTVVKSRYICTGSSRTTPSAYRGRAGGGARRQIGSALRYVELRTLGPQEQAEDRALFGALADHVARREARETLARLITPSVAYHSLVLSPGPLGEAMTVEQMRQWTRQVMADLARRWGGPVTWYAVVHRHTSHIHTHVIVAASRERPGGARQGIRFSREDFRSMRASGDRWTEQECANTYLLHEAENYAAQLLRLALVQPHSGGSGGRGPTDRDEIERSVRSHR
jgi:hypothetical protein